MHRPADAMRAAHRELALRWLSIPSPLSEPCADLHEHPQKQERDMRKPLGIHLLIASTVLFLFGCDYGHKPYRQASDTGVPGTTPLVIEIDDYGRFWNPASSEATLNAIDAASAGS